MAARWFLTIDGEFVQLDADDMPGEMWPLPVTQGGTGIDHLGPTNTLLVVGGSSGLFWRKLVPDNIQPEYRSGDGSFYIIGTLDNEQDGDILVKEGDSWVNKTQEEGLAHGLLSRTHSDATGEDAERGDLIIGTEDEQWIKLPLGDAGTVLRSDGDDLLYSQFRIADSGISGGIPYYSSNVTIESSAELTADLPVIGGGAGAAPTVGTVTGDTTLFATSTGTQSALDFVSIDSQGNHVASGIQTSGVLRLLTSTFLGGATTTITTSTFTAKKYLKVVILIPGLSASVTVRFQVGNASLDTGANYNIRSMESPAGGATWTNTQSAGQTFVLLDGTATANARIYSLEINNIAGSRKTMALLSALTPNQDFYLLHGDWNNTTDQIDVVGVHLSGAGNFNVGSGILVFGAE